MICVDQIQSLIKSEIKYNVKACTIKPDWLKDKEIIALDSEMRVYDIYPYGYTDLAQLRRVKEINYLLIRNKLGMYLTDTHESHHLNAYRTRQLSIWDHFNDVNKLSEEWWMEHVKHYGKKHSRFKKHLGTAENYLVDLERWLEKGNGSNYFSDLIKGEFITRINLVKETIEILKEEANAGSEVSESIDTTTEQS